MERQVAHNRAETAEEAGVGRGDHTETLPTVANLPLAAGPGPQSAIGVSRLQRLAEDTTGTQGNQLPPQKTLPQVAGKSRGSCHLTFLYSARGFGSGLTRPVGTGCGRRLQPASSSKTGSLLILAGVL